MSPTTHHHHRNPVQADADCCLIERLRTVSAQWADAASHDSERLAERLLNQVQNLESRLIATRAPVVDAAVAARLDRLHVPGEGATLDPPCMTCWIRSLKS